MTTHTPYDARIDDRSIFPYVRAKLRMKRDGYLQALADTQPRMDALMAACQQALPQIVSHFGPSGDLQDLLRTALKREGKEA